MPSAPDASTSVSLTPDAEPARSGRADDMIISTPDTAAIPMPAPISAPATTTPARFPATTDSAATVAPSAVAANPMPAMRPYPTRAAQPGLRSENTNDRSAVGTKYSPAASAP